MNCDPHFGNFVFNSVTKKLGLLDYGYCKALERGSMRSLAGWFLAIADDDSYVFVRNMLAQRRSARARSAQGRRSGG